MDGLKELGIEDNTIVIFTSDNGPAPSFKQIRANMMRGTKNSLYEGGIRMPFIIRWPDRIKGGQVNDRSIVTALDLFPSLCKMAGVELPDGYNPGGEDMSKALMGKKQTRKKDMMWDFGRNATFARPGNGNYSPHLAIRRGDWKLLMNSDGTRIELYNLCDDINETTNVADANPKLVEKLKTELLKWWDTRKVRPSSM